MKGIPVANYQDMALALAGTVQAATLTHQFALYGRTDDNPFTTTIKSILVQNPKTTLEVYEKPENLSLGLKKLKRLLEGPIDQEQKEISRYLVSLLYIQRQLIKNQQMFKALGRKIEHAHKQADYFSPVHPTIIASLAQAYRDTISTLSYRIQIIGEPRFLEVPENMNTLRALLLGGIRSAVLWQQVGGRRWQLFFCRGKLLRHVNRLLTEIITSE